MLVNIPAPWSIRGYSNLPYNLRRIDDQFEAEARAPIPFEMISSRGHRQVDTICSENPDPTKSGLGATLTQELYLSVFHI